MKKRILVRFAILIAVIGVLMSAIILLRRGMLAQFALEDAQRHYDSVWTEYPDDWKYTHVITANEENYNARIRSLIISDTSDVFAVLTVIPYVRKTNGHNEKVIRVTLNNDTLANRNVKLKWDSTPHYNVRVTFAGIGADRKPDLTAFFLDPYSSMLDSIMAHDTLTVICLTQKHQPSKFRFKLPPLDIVMRHNTKLITYTEKDTIKPQ